jgi:3-hydroxybutyryl-CoA dehydrogenase
MKIEEVRKIGVLGAGIMGHGIAQVAARSGYDIVLVDISDEILKKALQLIENGPFGLKRLVEKGKLNEDEAKKILSRIKTSTDLESLKDCDIVIEAIPEDPDLKKKIFGQLDKICKPECIFASNTSGIMISDLATAVDRKDRFIGMHWFNPAPVMKLIEVVRGALTSEETFELIVELSKKFGKIPVEAADVPGFFTTRYIVSWMNEAIRLFERGIAGIKEIDTMCKLAFGFPMGPFELMDLIGLDTAVHICEYLHRETGEEQFVTPISLKKLVLSGYLGDERLKPGSKGGWYRYYRIEK